ncbi:Enolase [Symmachiella dynata]|uniref:phosphopyruvate hydratase n=1 Tax=Symmachiella dynata TaxID=2527995 RepID=UPI00118C8287|nr:phosphopyruvate hydratase [Symmachiella dynata]QDT48449.1 Enolase [Symmachiella dynata]
MPKIEQIHAREVFDSRGKPTVEVEIRCADSRAGRAIVPSGASTGRFEACELRDGDTNRFGGNGVLQAVSHVNHEIAAALTGMDAADQQSIDRALCELDGTENKSRLGANAILGVSLAAAHAAAEAKQLPLWKHFAQLWQTAAADLGQLPQQTSALGQQPIMPLPMVNMISGGLHAGRNLDFQDYLILPVGATSYREALEWIITIYHRLGRLLTEKGYEGVLVGDEGGYGPKLTSNVQAIELVIEAIEACGRKPGTDVAIGLDVASSHFFDGTHYRLAATGDERLNSGDVIDLLEKWVSAYPIVSIEDGLAEDDWEGWQELTRRLGDRAQLIGDDLFVTNRRRLEKGLELAAGNSVLIKVNQIGTVWETFETLRLALQNGFWPVVSARSGETEDHTIADLAVATAAGQIKIGSIARSERLVKYNQLLRLEEQVGHDAYQGGRIFSALKS